MQITHRERHHYKLDKPPQRLAHHRQRKEAVQSLDSYYALALESYFQKIVACAGEEPAVSWMAKMHHETRGEKLRFIQLVCELCPEFCGVAAAAIAELTETLK